jgi:uncharacterized protein (DUF885 family)
MAALSRPEAEPEATMPDDVNALADRYHEFRLATYPTWAHLQGDYRFAGRFEDVSRAADDRTIAAERAFAAEAEAIPVDRLTSDERITREMVAWDARTRADLLSSRLEEFAADPIFGAQAMLGVRIPKLTLPNAEVAEAMTSKLKGIATHFRDLADRHREGVASGRTPADFAVRQTIDQLDAWLARPVADDPLLTTAEPQGVADVDAWRGRLRDVIAKDVRPALQTYRDTLRDEVLPKARPDEHCGLTWLADGAEAYERTIRFYTTVELSAQEIHEIGIRQVSTLADEYRALGPEVVGSSDLDRIFEGLRSDPALHHTNAEEIVAASKKAMAKARAAMGDWFGIAPKADCDVEATPSGAIAFYFPPAKDGSRGGVFFMNTSDPTGWGRYDIESTSYHEGIPGHHLQMAISGELESIPEFRKRAFIAAYGEGWGLYTERLADEMGLYSSPLDRIGMLSADSMRACRLVVDTGMHALGWSRRQAIDYMLANSPMREGHVNAEIDRYAVTPGQALAYMIGRLEIQKIRREAEANLGDRFDIRAFHDAVLGSGPMPLPVLARHVRETLTPAA